MTNQPSKYSVFVEDRLIASFQYKSQVFPFLYYLCPGLPDNTMIEIEKLDNDYYMCFYAISGKLEKYPTGACI